MRTILLLAAILLAPVAAAAASGDIIFVGRAQKTLTNPDKVMLRDLVLESFPGATVTDIESYDCIRESDGTWCYIVELRTMSWDDFFLLSPDEVSSISVASDSAVIVMYRSPIHKLTSAQLITHQSWTQLVFPGVDTTTIKSLSAWRANGILAAVSYVGSASKQQFLTKFAAGEISKWLGVVP